MSTIYIAYDNVMAHLDTSVSPDVINLLYDELKYRPDGYEHVYSFKSGRWDGYNRLFNIQDRSFRRGLVGRVVSLLEKYGHSVYTKYTTSQLPEYHHKFSTQLIRPYEFQTLAVDAGVKGDIGLIVAPTGTGKSVCISKLISAIKRKTLVVVTDIVLLDQMHQVLQRYFDQDIGIIGDGEFNLQDITVSTIQSLLSFTKTPKSIKKADVWKEFHAYTKTIGAIISDECFPYHSTIHTDEGLYYIGALYSKVIRNEILPKVLSWDDNSKSFTYKPIVNAFRKECADLIKITFSDHKTITCTINHKFLTLNGWTKAEDLTNLDVVLGYTNPTTLLRGGALICNSDQEQALLGSFLGDGNISIHGRKLRLRIQHGHKQYSYNKWKASMFNIGKLNYIKHNGFSGKPANRFATKQIYFAPLINIKSKKDMNDLPDSILSNLDWRGVAIWYMDDGSVNKKKNGTISASRLHTESFQSKIQQKLVSWFSQHGIEAKIALNKRINKNYLYINRTNTLKLHAAIAKFVRPEFKYKIDQKYHQEIGTYEWNVNFRNESAFPVINTNRCTNKTSRKPYVYDLEIADTHNYVVSNTKNCHTSGSMYGLIAHNCHLSDTASFANVMPLFTNADKIIGFSATPYGWGEKAEKKHNLELEQHFGRAIYDCRKINFVELGLKVPVLVNVSTRTPIRKEYKQHTKRGRYGPDIDWGKNYKDCLNIELLQNPAYHEDVAYKARELANSGKSSFIHAAHSIEFGENICKLIPGAVLVNGKTPRMERRRIYDAMRSKDLLTIVSDVGATGLDIPSLDAIILASDIKDVRQLKGRVERKSPSKEYGLLIDFNTTTQFLAKHHSIRRSQYENDNNIIIG